MGICRSRRQTEPGHKYSGSNDPDMVAWYDDNSGKTTHPVGTKAANELGIHDMSGNVYEWCWDWHDYNYYGMSPESSPPGAASGTDRVCRGGSWISNVNFSLVAKRFNDFPFCRFCNRGFRVLRALK